MFVHHLIFRTHTHTHTYTRATSYPHKHGLQWRLMRSMQTWYEVNGLFGSGNINIWVSHLFLWELDSSKVMGLVPAVSKRMRWVEGTRTEECNTNYVMPMPMCNRQQWIYRKVHLTDVAMNAAFQPKMDWTHERIWIESPYQWAMRPNAPKRKFRYQKL